MNKVLNVSVNIGPDIVCSTLTIRFVIYNHIFYYNYWTELDNLYKRKSFEMYKMKIDFNVYCIVATFMFFLLYNLIIASDTFIQNFPSKLVFESSFDKMTSK